MTSFGVVPDELQAHASHLGGLVDRLNTAVSAAGTVSMDNSAYGILCAFLPPIINVLTQQHASDTLNAAVSGMTDTADNVRTAATNYEQQDQNAASPFQSTIDGSDPSTGSGGYSGGYGSDPSTYGGGYGTGTGGYSGGYGNGYGSSTNGYGSDPSTYGGGYDTGTGGFTDQTGGYGGYSDETGGYTDQTGGYSGGYSDQTGGYTDQTGGYSGAPDTYDPSAAQGDTYYPSAAQDGGYSSSGTTGPTEPKQEML